MQTQSNRVRQNGSASPAAQQSKIATGNKRRSAAHAVAPARLLFLDGVTGEQFANLELSHAEIHALILGSMASGLTVAQLIKVAIDEKIAAAKWAGSGKALATDLASSAARFRLKRAVGNHAPEGGETLPRSIKRLAEAIGLSATERQKLALLAQWEGESPLEFCRNSVLAFFEASRDDMELFALRKHDLPKERAWARKFFSRVAPLFQPRRPAANLQAQTGGVR